MSTDGDPSTGQRNVDFVWLFLKLGGRVSRKAYALAAALMVVVQVFVFYRIGLAEEGSPEFGMWMFGFMLVFPLIMWASFALSVKRLHDIGKPGALALMLFIPMLSAIVFIVLCLIPGDKGANRYGPTPNTPG